MNITEARQKYNVCVGYGNRKGQTIYYLLEPKVYSGAEREFILVSPDPNGTLRVKGRGSSPTELEKLIDWNKTFSETDKFEKVRKLEADKSHDPSDESKPG